MSWRMLALCEAVVVILAGGLSGYDHSVMRVDHDRIDHLQRDLKSALDSVERRCSPPMFARR